MALLNFEWVRLHGMGVDRGEVERSSDEEDHGFHRLEAGVSTRLAVGGPKELQAPHLVHGLARVSDDMELVEGDPGIREIVSRTSDEGR
jgi:hypothetical protein